MKPARWRNELAQLRPGVDELKVGEWYRSPIWEQSHVLGRKPEFQPSTTWCGRDLLYARDLGDEVLGGLFIENRTTDSARCAHCKNSENGWRA